MFTFHRVFFVFCLAVCGMVAWANYEGRELFGSDDTNWSRQGVGAHGGFYHK